MSQSRVLDFIFYEETSLISVLPDTFFIYNHLLFFFFDGKARSPPVRYFNWYLQYVIYVAGNKMFNKK